MPFLLLVLTAMACVLSIAGWSALWALLALTATSWGTFCAISVCGTAAVLLRAKQSGPKV